MPSAFVILRIFAATKCSYLGDESGGSLDDSETPNAVKILQV
jgi:hypothetical protein